MRTNQIVLFVLKTSHIKFQALVTALKVALEDTMKQQLI